MNKIEKKTSFFNGNLSGPRKGAFPLFLCVSRCFESCIFTWAELKFREIYKFTNTFIFFTRTEDGLAKVIGPPKRTVKNQLVLLR